MLFKDLLKILTIWVVTAHMVPHATAQGHHLRVYRIFFSAPDIMTVRSFEVCQTTLSERHIRRGWAPRTANNRQDLKFAVTIFQHSFKYYKTFSSQGNNFLQLFEPQNSTNNPLWWQQCSVISMSLLRHRLCEIQVSRISTWLNKNMIGIENIFCGDWMVFLRRRFERFTETKKFILRNSKTIILAAAIPRTTRTTYQRHRSSICIIDPPRLWYDWQGIGGVDWSEAESDPVYRIWIVNLRSLILD